MKKFMFKGIISLMVFVLLVGCTAKEEKANTVVVGFDNTFVPMGFVDEKNEIVGFDIDLAVEVFNRLNYEVTFQNIDWSMKEQALNNKNVDVLWNGYTITEERKEKVLFSDPYLDNRQIIITMADSNFASMDDLNNQIVATQAASSALDAIENNEEFIAIIKNQTPVTYDTYDKALRDLEIGRVQAVVGDEVLLKYYISQRGSEKYKILEEDLGSEQYGIGFRKEDTALRDEVNRVLSEMKEDGTFDKIKEKWFK